MTNVLQQKLEIVQKRLANIYAASFNQTKVI